MINKIDYSVKWDANIKKKLEKYPSVVMYSVASMALDMSYNRIPLRRYGTNAGKLRQTSKASGVRQDGNGYSIGSFTNYAVRVYNLPDSTNWSTPGTGNQWYSTTWKKYQNTITEQAIKRSQIS